MSSSSSTTPSNNDAITDLQSELSTLRKLCLNATTRLEAIEEWADEMNLSWPGKENESGATSSATLALKTTMMEKRLEHQIDKSVNDLAHEVYERIDRGERDGFLEMKTEMAYGMQRIVQLMEKKLEQEHLRTRRVAQQAIIVAKGVRMVPKSEGCTSPKWAAICVVCQEEGKAEFGLVSCGCVTVTV
uniref:Uncharacterized protein n=1 Tax=Globodera rostochiensis TaxID=31243 RepID=A0A914GUL6_GLORO